MGHSHFMNKADGAMYSNVFPWDMKTRNCSSLLRMGVKLLLVNRLTVLGSFSAKSNKFFYILRHKITRRHFPTPSIVLTSATAGENVHVSKNTQRTCRAASGHFPKLDFILSLGCSKLGPTLQ